MESGSDFSRWHNMRNVIHTWQSGRQQWTLQLSKDKIAGKFFFSNKIQKYNIDNKLGILRLKKHSFSHMFTSLQYGLSHNLQLF